MFSIQAIVMLVLVPFGVFAAVYGGISIIKYYKDKQWWEAMLEEEDAPAGEVVDKCCNDEWYFEYEVSDPVTSMAPTPGPK